MSIRITLFLSFLLFPSQLLAQSSDKYLKKMSHERGILLFLEAQKWKNKSQEPKKLEADFTVNLMQDTLSWVQCNFTLWGKQPVEEVYALFLRQPQQQWVSHGEVEGLLLEKEKGRWRCRFSATFSVDDFLAFLGAEGEGALVVESPQGIWEYHPGFKWKKWQEVVLPMIRVEKKKL